METGTKIEKLSLAGSHACCGTIFRAAGRFREFRACGSFKSQTKNKMSLRFNNRASSGKFAKISTRNLSNTAKLHEGLYSWNRKRKIEAKTTKTDIPTKYPKYFTRAASVRTRSLRKLTRALFPHAVMKLFFIRKKKTVSKVCHTELEL